MVVNDEVIEYINQFNDSVVYAVVDDVKKTVYINYSTKFKNKLGTVFNLVTKLGGRLELVSSVAHPVYKLIMAEGVRVKYMNAGYTITNQKLPFIRFKAHVRLDAEHKWVLVYLVSGKGQREIVAIFKSFEEANNFANEFYGDSWRGEIVYAVGGVYKHSKLARTAQKVESSGSIAGE